ncbi:hydantoinase/oxoprolinase family protein [Actinoplanes solisilvae]|uniref:hydantoinase/oxoprolinase family protein n=1 Tax=Actinoplanes solisilvae TaxID=2486853 RepID=UPI000FD76F76|nr:hydantoinase/oxoprolinase family protein [Actinoplanes solisilvae]
MSYRLGVDVGGTFTDVLLVDEDTGSTWRAKTASTPSDQSVGVLHGIDKVCAEAGIDRQAVAHVLHGTTVATNAILEGKGATVGLVTTEGFRQVLQIARSFVPGGLAGWIIWPKPEPLAALENTVEVPERVASDGSVVRELDEDAARQALGRLREQGVEALAVSLINAFANGAHERRLAELAAEELPGVEVSLSSVVLPEMREYERALTTVANGYVQPHVARYVANLSAKLAAEGVPAELSILRSDGGLAAAHAAIGAPVTMLLSGPAGGVAGAVWVAEQSGHTELLTFDMGGTSTDVALVRQGQARIGRETKVGDLTVRASAVDVRTVGAGGGSIAHVPELTRALRVGPQSAGAEPGPAAYGKGGNAPTVTDANVVLGYLPSTLAGGEIALDRDAARAAVQTIADAMGLDSAEQAAAGIVDIVNENMLGGLRLVSVQQGFDPREFALVAFGGAGPLHANALGRLTGAWPVIVPPSPGVLCALGDATTSARDESARTVLRKLGDLSPDEFAVIFTELAAAASGRLIEQGVPAEKQTIGYSADLRYVGQGNELPVTFSFENDGLDGLAGRFDAEHERLFSFTLGVDHELVNARATVTGARPRVAPVHLDKGDGDPAAARTGSTRIYVDGGFVDAALYDRLLLRAGDVVTGPAIVTEMDSTTLILPGHAATTDPNGSLLIRPLESLEG